MNKSRRDFVKKTLTGAAAVSFGGVLPGFNAKSYASIIGANERIKVASMGVNSRGFAVGINFASQPDCEVIYSCDVDKRANEKFVAAVEKVQNKKPKAKEDFRNALDDKQLDALLVTCPDHWHAPATILALQAGKHVYLEKPCSHNPYEGELLIEAVKKYNKVVQMGNQRRSFPNSIEAIRELRSGVIGRPYFAKAWYSNNRHLLEEGKEVPVPSWLNYELWQGPAPRQPYKDNIIHYNWHWFWNWGTGEALNNGTHTVDLARWGLGVDYPISVSSSGGRYQQKNWETPDTQVINMEFDNKTLISWEGRSCNNHNIEGDSVGVIFYGEKGSLVLPGSNQYRIYDEKGKILKEVKNEIMADESLKLSDPTQQLDVYHIRNFFDGIRKGSKLNSDIESGHKSTLLVQLGNISLRSGQSLKIDPKNGHIIDNEEAMKYWSRDYEPGWEPKLIP
ncbi:MAG: Gfo/Idh/MocA family oxidoreductase [Bacteroidota bacterium]|nr:Gfo/Idh/MocA family oxidoreductase [Bacteroidota bacterium]